MLRPLIMRLIASVGLLLSLGFSGLVFVFHCMAVDGPPNPFKTVHIIILVTPIIYSAYHAICPFNASARHIDIAVGIMLQAAMAFATIMGYSLDLSFGNLVAHGYLLLFLSLGSLWFRALFRSESIST
ncbi:MAG: hypothetical protein QOD99_1732 [Chthoniobacter sp.]|jgi:hypothetical protein|nr:hypothetical protein [Chthoniobacter sp.]